jgi:hypothetical protein
MLGVASSPKNEEEEEAAMLHSVAGLELLTCLIDRQRQDVASVVLALLPVVVAHTRAVNRDQRYIDLALKTISTPTSTYQVLVCAHERSSDCVCVPRVCVQQR